MAYRPPATVEQEDPLVNRRRWAAGVAAAVLLAPPYLSFVLYLLRTLPFPRASWSVSVPHGFGVLLLTGSAGGIVRILPLVAFAVLFAVQPTRRLASYWLLPAVFAAEGTATVLFVGGALWTSSQRVTPSMIFPSSINLAVGVVYFALAAWLWSARPRDTRPVGLGPVPTVRT